MIRNRVLPLLLTAIITGFAVLYFYETKRTIRDDKWLALALVAAWMLIFIQMVVATDRWRLLELALLVTVVGLVAFFASFLGPLWGWYESTHFIAALYRGCFLVSAPMLIIHSVRLLLRDRPDWLRGRSGRVVTVSLVVFLISFALTLIILAIAS